VALRASYDNELRESESAASTLSALSTSALLPLAAQVQHTGGDARRAGRLLG